MDEGAVPSQTKKEATEMNVNKGYEFLQLLSRAILAPQISLLFPILGNVNVDRCNMNYYTFASRIADALYNQAKKD